MRNGEEESILNGAAANWAIKAVFTVNSWFTMTLFLDW